MSYLAAARDKYLAGPPIDVLDVGGGALPHRELFRGVEREYIGTDSQRTAPGVVVADATSLPFGDDRFGLVLCTQVLEHLEDPAAVAREIRRVLSPGGFAFISVPFAYPHHPHPGDYWRWSGDGLRLMLERAGLEVLEVVPQRATGSCLALLCNFYLNALANRLHARFLALPGFALLNVLGPLLDVPFRRVRSGALVTNHLAVARKRAHHAPAHRQ